MNFNNAIYGVDKPSATRRHIINGVLLVTGLMFWGMYAEFVPSEFWFRTGTRIAIALGVLVSIIALHAIWKGWAVFKSETSLLAKGLVLLLLPVVVVAFLWVATVHGAPAVVNQFFGSDEVYAVTLDKVRSTSRHACSYQLHGDFLDRAFPSQLCISSAYYSQPPESGRVLLHGRETKFGFLVKAIYDGEQ